MTGNTLPRTPSETLGLDLAPLYEAVGIPDTHLNNPDTAHQALWATIAYFGEGEIALPLKTSPTEAFARELFGEISYVEGTLGPQLVELQKSHDPELSQQATSFLQAGARHLISKMFTPKSGIKLPHKQVAITPMQHAPCRLDVDNFSMDLPARPRRIIEYGPGFHGAHYLHQQFIDASRAKQPYEYHPISRDPFIREALTEMARYHQKAGENWHPLQQEQLNKALKSRSDGMASASSELALTMEGQFDLAIASMIHTADPEAVDTTLYNTIELLDDEGRLLIRAPEEPYGDQLTANEMLETALGAGFDKNEIIKHRAPLTALPDGRAVTPVSYLLRK